ncbi:hypothetical protein Vadar_003252 [Vaccinium darrowii]|nr:hypothetical protein Vadar_003252 [Vaccinium darrowii]
MVFVEPAIGSDHNPLVLNTDVSLNKVGRPFRFESFWVTEAGCKEVIVDAWSRQQEGSLMLKVCKKLKVCKEMLKEWSKHTFGELRFRIDSAKEHLSDIQHKMELGFYNELLIEETRILQVLEDLWQKDAIRQRNQIVRLKNEQGIWKENPKDIAGVIKNYFHELYKMPLGRDLDAVIDLIDPSISTDCKMILTRSISKGEVQQAAFHMGALKAPGSDGFPGLFYQSYWDKVGDDVFKVVHNFFQEGALLKEVNQTNVILIPKVPNPESMSQLCLISFSATTNNVDCCGAPSPSSELIRKDLDLVAEQKKALQLMDSAFQEYKIHMDKQISKAHDHHRGALSPASKLIRSDLILVDTTFSEAKESMYHMNVKINQAREKFKKLQIFAGSEKDFHKLRKADSDKLRKTISKLKGQIRLHNKIRPVDSNLHHKNWDNINGAEDGMTHFFHKEPEVAHTGDFGGLLKFESFP